MYVLRSKRNPEDVQRTSNKGLRDWYVRHGYEEIGETAALEPPLETPKRGKKFETFVVDDVPPSDLSTLADEISEGEGD